MKGRRMTANINAYTSADSRFIPAGKAFLMVDDPFREPTPNEMDTAVDLLRLGLLPAAAPSVSEKEDA